MCSSDRALRIVVLEAHAYGSLPTKLPLSVCSAGQEGSRWKYMTLGRSLLMSGSPRGFAGTTLSSMEG